MAEQQAQPSTSTAPQQPEGKSPIRLVVRVILFAILLYLLCALPYDFLIARPAQQEAWKKLQNDDENAEEGKLGLLQTKNLRPGEVDTTNETVAQTLGRKPSSTKEVEFKGLKYVQETYCWRGGLIFRTYDIHVIYRKNKDGKLLLEHGYLNESPYDVAEEAAQSQPPPDGAAEALTPGVMPSTTPGGPGGSQRPDAEAPGEKPADESKKPDAEEPAKKPADADAPKTPAEADTPKKTAAEGAEKKAPK